MPETPPSPSPEKSEAPEQPDCLPPLQPISRHLLIWGKVQGVGYRAYACHQARRLGLNGWVRNLSDGKVEAVISGSEKSIAEFLDCAHIGTANAHVNLIQVDEAERPESDGFEQWPTAAAAAQNPWGN